MHQQFTNSSRIRKYAEILLTVSIWCFLLCSQSQPAKILDAMYQGLAIIAAISMTKTFLSYPQVVWQMMVLLCDYILNNFSQIFYKV